MKHTLGQWKAFGPPESPKDPDDKLDMAIEVIIDGRPRIIAECFGRVGETIYLDAKANARLMAAAPEMLEVLELMNRYYGSADNEGLAQLRIAKLQMESVIKKARGEE